MPEFTTQRVTHPKYSTKHNAQSARYNLHTQISYAQRMTYIKSSGCYNTLLLPNQGLIDNAYQITSTDELVIPPKGELKHDWEFGTTQHAVSMITFFS